MHKRSARIALSVLLVLAALASTLALCDWGDGNGTNGQTNVQQEPKAIMTLAADATATYGAEQFHIQLTAISEESQTP